jgi:hypothetical protein
MNGSEQSQSQSQSRPTVRDQTGWELLLLEHRRILFERVVQQFPDVLKTRRTDVEIWRARLTAEAADTY